MSVGQIITKSAAGRATVDRLKMNDTSLVTLRRLLADLGLFPEVVG